MPPDFPKRYAETVHTLGVTALQDLASALERRLERPGVQVVLLILSPEKDEDASSVLSTTQDPKQLKDLHDALSTCIADLAKPATQPPNLH